MSERTCSIEGCERPHLARGWCTMHYERWRRHGDPNVVLPRLGRTDGEFVEPSSLEARFWPKVAIPENPLDCWIWTASVDKVSGYGRITVKRKTGYAHRISYELSMGHIGQGLEIDHLCRNKSCVNPLHLQAVPAAINVQRTPRVAKTHCPQGHPYSGDNLRVSNGRRYCRTCNIEKSRAHYQAKKSA